MANTLPLPALARVVASYLFDRGSGSSESDLSVNGNRGTICGAAWEPAERYGKAPSFDRLSSWVTRAGFACTESLSVTAQIVQRMYVGALNILWRGVILASWNRLCRTHVCSPALDRAEGMTVEAWVCPKALSRWQPHEELGNVNTSVDWAEVRSYNLRTETKRDSSSMYPSLEG